MTECGNLLVLIVNRKRSSCLDIFVKKVSVLVFILDVGIYNI